MRIIVLQADLELDGFEEVSLLGLEGVLKELLDVGTHSGCGKVVSFYSWCSAKSQIVSRDGEHTDCDFRHDDSLPVEIEILMVRICVMFVLGMIKSPGGTRRNLCRPAVRRG